MAVDDKPLLRPHLVIREESDACALLHDPDRRLSFVLNPVGLCLCRALNGKRTPAELAAVVRRTFRTVPAILDDDLRFFLDQLLLHNLATGGRPRYLRRRGRRLVLTAAGRAAQQRARANA